MRTAQARRYGSRMQFPDSTFSALRIDGDRFDRSWTRLLWLAVALPLVAASAGVLAGG